MTSRPIIVLTLFFAICGPLHADEMVTDRPDATESSSVVRPGFLQVESGWTFTDTGETRRHEVPNTLLRIGAVDRLEMRLGWGGYIEDSSSDGASGASDGELGAKVYLCEERGAWPEAALLVGVSLPWGAGDVTSDEFDPAFRFAMSHTLTENLSLGYNLGVEWATEDDSTLSSFIYTVSLGAGLTDRVGAYIELFGAVGLSASGPSHTLDGGFTYLLAENLQLDTSGGVGLNSKADDWFVGAGVSYRFPY
jgi:hypothetical protein